MELLEMMKMVPMPILVLVTTLIVIVTAYMLYQWMKMKRFDGIRIQTYQLILKAEHIFNESSSGKQKLKWVVSQARKLLPCWMQLVISEKTLEKIINEWFKGVKDLLDDGKMNYSQKDK